MKTAARGTASKTDSSETYTTGEMARLSDTTLRTVRFYEEAGILQPIGRTEGGHRLFEAVQLERLMLVSDMREAGLSLEEIRTLLEAKSSAVTGGSAAQKAVPLLREKVSSLRQKIQVLSRLAEDLDRTLERAHVCLDCHDDTQFPSQCGACTRTPASQRDLASKSAQATSLPRGLRVLWGVSPSGPVEARGKVETPSDRGAE